jgi:hypothetical protein
MAVGEYVKTKFTWLLDDVEVVGVARSWDGDSFDVELDANYAHLIATSRGNNPLPWKPNGTAPALHLETYVPEADRVNHDNAYPIQGKPDGQNFVVKLPDGSTRDLTDGDRVRVRGRWVIDHHPEFCDNFGRCHYRGWLKVGQVHMELHPFRWDDIRLEVDPQWYEHASLVLSLAAPIHEEQYLGGWKWFANEVAGVSGKIFIADDESNFHRSMNATVRLAAPTFPASWTDVYRELRFSEDVRHIDATQTVAALRTITPDATGITVAASVTAIYLGREHWPTIEGPAMGMSIFQAQYRVWWDLVGARISCVKKPHRSDPTQHIDAVGGVLPDGSPWRRQLEDAIVLTEKGHRFYVEEPGSDRVAVEVAQSRYGNKYLRTVTDFEIPNNLLALPECPDLID